MAMKKVSRSSKSPKPVKVLSSQEDALATKIIKASGVKKIDPRIGTKVPEGDFKIRQIFKVSPGLKEVYAMHAVHVERGQELMAQIEKLGKRTKALHDRFWLQARQETGLFGDQKMRYDKDTGEIMILED